MLKSISRDKPLFSFDDYNAMLALQCGDEDVNAHLIDLHAVAMEVEEWQGEM